jgi:hypothetical protein
MKLKSVQNVDASLKSSEGAAQRLLLEELQAEIFRLEARLNQRLDAILKNRPELLRLHLTYSTARLEIAIGSNPELDLFDMIAFLETTRSNLGRHRATEKKLIESFDASVLEAWDVAKLILDSRQLGDLRHLISSWIESHPDAEVIDRLRFSRSAESMRADLADSDPRGVRRLINHANQALRVANSTHLLAERGFHYAQRLPTLMRLHLRVGARELVTESWSAIKTALKPRKWPTSASRLKSVRRKPRGIETAPDRK